MRTTLNLDDDVLESVKDYAQARSIALGEAVSRLVRRGLDAPFPTKLRNGIPVFDVPAGNVDTQALAKQVESEQDARNLRMHVPDGMRTIHKRAQRNEDFPARRKRAYRA